MEVTIKGTKYALQPFTAGQLRREASAKLASIEDLSAKLTAGEMTPGRALPDLVGNACDLVLLSLNNKYPEIALDDVESLSFSEIQAAVTSAVEASRMSGEMKPQRVSR